MPEMVAFCPRCQRDRLMSEMIRETNPISKAVGRLVCNRVGCYIGPSIDTKVVFEPEPASPYPYD